MSKQNTRSMRGRSCGEDVYLLLEDETVYIQTVEDKIAVGDVIDLWDLLKAQLLAIEDPEYSPNGTERRKDEVRAIQAYGWVRQQSKLSF